MTPRERRKVAKYHIMLNIATPCLAMSFVPLILMLILQMIDDLFLVNSKSEHWSSGIDSCLIIVVVNITLFSYSLIRVKIGMELKAWRQLVKGRPDMDSCIDMPTQQIAMATSAATVGRMSENAGASAAAMREITDAAAVASAAMDSQVRQVAKRYGVKLPNVTPWIIAVYLLPVLIIGAVYTPRFMESYRFMQEDIEARSNTMEALEKAYEPYCYRIHADDPTKNDDHPYYLQMSFDEEGKCDLRIKINPDGSLESISYYYDLDADMSLGENVQEMEVFVQKASEPLRLSGVDYDGLCSLNYISDEVKQKFLTADRANREWNEQTVWGENAACTYWFSYDAALEQKSISEHFSFCVRKKG